MGEASQLTAEAVTDNMAAIPVVHVRDFCKRYRNVVAARGVDLDVRRGQIHGLIGPDGAGKSSLMKAIAGVLTFDSGDVEVLGVRLESEQACERIKRRIGFMPQGLGQNLYADLSIEENVDFFGRLRLIGANELAARTAVLLSITRLDRFKSRPVKQLSGGMKQKLALVCSLIHEPELIILDEPTTGVDPVSRRDFWAILAELLQQKGITALVSTAYMDEASRFHRIALMFAGQVIASGEPDDIQQLVPGTVVSLKSRDQVQAFGRLKEKRLDAQALGSWLKVFVGGADREAARRTVEEAVTGIAVDHLQVTEPDLEDVFVSLLRKRPLSASGVTTTTGPVEIIGRRQDHMAIEATGLTRDFDGFRAVDHVTFRVQQGEIFGLLGANGAGKTTAIKMLTGLIRPTAGIGRVAGADMRTASQDIKERIGYMSQAFSLYTDLTVIENINLYSGIYGLSARERKPRAEWVIGMAGLSGHETDSTASLPMGLRQRLALGCALVHRPDVLFLDEPTSGVDPVGRRQFWDILFRLSRQEGVAMLVTTHYLSEAEHCDHLALMYDGRIVADAPPERMKSDVEMEAGRLVEVTAAQLFLARKALAEAGFQDPVFFGKRIHLLSRSAEADLLRIPTVLSTAGIAGATATLRPLSMEDAFVYRVTALQAKERVRTAGAVHEVHA